MLKGKIRRTQKSRLIFFMLLKPKGQISYPRNGSYGASYRTP